MTNKATYIIFLIIGFFCSPISHAQEDAFDLTEVGDVTVNTADLVESALSCTDCYEWRLIGICFWLRCRLYSCEVNTSVKVGHFIPDIVVSTYSVESAWEDTVEWNNVNNGAISKMEPMTGNDMETPIDYKHADLIAHPALPIYNELGEEDYFCESVEDTPFTPYFLSGYDPFWSNPIIERFFPEAFFGEPKIETEIRGPIIGGYWGRTYPRNGWGVHPFEAINGAVAAHRAAHIVTRTSQIHFYQNPGDDCGNRCWAPEGIIENDARSHKFQMVAPVAETTGQPFGGQASWANGKGHLKEKYVFNLWRPYECCEREGQVFLFDIEFNN